MLPVQPVQRSPRLRMHWQQATLLLLALAVLLEGQVLLLTPGRQTARPEGRQACWGPEVLLVLLQAQAVQLLIPLHTKKHTNLSCEQEPDTKCHHR